jgi:hypothetical protein
MQSLTLSKLIERNKFQEFLKPRPIYSRGKTSRLAMNRRLGESQNRSGCFVEEKNIFPCRESNPKPSSP